MSLSTSWLQALLWFAAIGSGIMAGVYFVFSTFAMRSFDSLSPAAAVEAMNAINRIILQSLFMPLFFATTLVALLLSILAVFASAAGDGLRWAVLTGGVVYVVGMFLCTAVFNVPLNNALAAVSGDLAVQESAWRHYQLHWTRWNHVRALASTLSAILFTAALISL